MTTVVRCHAVSVQPVALRCSSAQRCIVRDLVGVVHDAEGRARDFRVRQLEERVRRRCELRLDVVEERSLAACSAAHPRLLTLCRTEPVLQQCGAGPAPTFGQPCLFTEQRQQPDKLARLHLEQLDARLQTKHLTGGKAYRREGKAKRSAALQTRCSEARCIHPQHCRLAGARTAGGGAQRMDCRSRKPASAPVIVRM